MALQRGDRLAVLTSGGDAPGMNAALRAAARVGVEMGFDVVYLPPIHPVGTINRKGPNNTLTPAAGDPGSPWAIGSADGGHDTIHPDLGTIDDFDTFVERFAAGEDDADFDASGFVDETDFTEFVKAFEIGC